MLIDENKAAHAHGVAELMYKFAHKFALNMDTKKLYLLGYLYNAKDVLSGLSIVEDPTWTQCVIHCSDIPDNVYNISPELICLWWADCMVESSGENAGKVIGFTQRLYNLKLREGRNSKAYEDMVRKQNWLIKHLPEGVPSGVYATE